MTERTHADVLHRFIETHVICAGKRGSKPGYTDAHEALGALLAERDAAVEALTYYAGPDYDFGVRARLALAASEEK